MAKPIRHAESSARRYGGAPADHLPIHDFLDSSKGAFPSNAHRALTHHSWFLSTVLEKVFGPRLIVAAKPEFESIAYLQREKRRAIMIQLELEERDLVRQGYLKEVSVRDVGEMHVLEDFGQRFIPTAQDYLAEMEMKDWMNNGIGGSTPPSFRKIDKARTTKELTVD